MEELKDSYIYKLVSPQTNKVYIGSTTKKISERLHDHRADYKRHINNNFHYITSFEIMKYGDVKIELIEKMNCTKHELHTKERYYIELYRENAVNKIIPTRTVKEGGKEYRERNREVIAEKKKVYCQKNKDKLKEKSSLKCNCECGSIIRKNEYTRHLKTKKHIHYITINITNCEVTINNPTQN